MSTFHHDGMDHGTDDTEAIECNMNMAFHFGSCEFILFRSWQANTEAKFVAACVAFFVMAFFYEGLKYYREVLFIKAEQSRQAVVKSSDGEVITTPVKLTIKEQMLNAPHFYQTFLHLGQVFISYILMLIVMLCNLWLIFAICLGAAVGYFTFGWLRKITYRDANECCY